MKNMKPQTITFITRNPEHVETDIPSWEEDALCFEVPYDWAVEYCNGEDELCTFYWESTTDDTMSMYCIALLENVIISEKTVNLLED